MAFIKVPVNYPPQDELSKMISRLPPAPTFPKKMHPDLKKERDAATFDPSALNLAVLCESPQLRDLRRRMKSIFESDPVFQSPEDQFFLKKHELYSRALKLMNRGRELQLKYQIPEDLSPMFWDVGGEAVPILLHYSMGIPTIEKQASEEQKKKWLPMAYKWEMVLCYAQTEAAHGSNVRGIETTATYIPETDEFDIHSPTLEAYKWWPGSMSKTANFAIVFAQLIVANKNHGVYPFLVQLRDIKTHRVLPKISIRDLGPKIGFNVMDNGIVGFDHVRIPREQMLMGNIQVTSDGKVIKGSKKDQVLVYSTLLQMRAGIVMGGVQALSRAATIVARYSVIRRQFPSPNSTTEVQIINYQSQLNKILIPLATAFACQFTGNQINHLVNQMHLTNSKEKLIKDVLPGLHATSSGLKVLVSTLCSDMLENLRRACGGHGFSRMSGLPDLFCTYVQMYTVEGENSVLTQQTVRYLLKRLSVFLSTPNASTSSLPQQLHYIALIPHLSNIKCTVQSITDWQKPNIIISLLEVRAAWLLKSLNELLKEREWNDVLVEVDKLCVAHAWLYMYQSFVDSLKELETKEGVTLEMFKVMELLRDLFGVFAVQTALVDVPTYLTPTQHTHLLRTHHNLLSQLRPHVVPLTDSFELTDRELNSAIGKYDGLGVYQKMYEWACNKEELNKVDVVSGWSELDGVRGKMVAKSKL
ncbi:hypothetical protein BKA69DRAFT_260176 [Paraphysoderma sedebokerense]|nr:hypothetical protein BKA69DRAFT_260176 [Paraphysoderma sedebokerense]